MNMSNHCSAHYRYCSITQSFFDDSPKTDENLLENDCLWKNDLENGKSKRQVVSAVFTYDESQTLRNDLLLLILLFKPDEFMALCTVQAVEPWVWYNVFIFLLLPILFDVFFHRKKYYASGFIEKYEHKQILVRSKCHLHNRMLFMAGYIFFNKFLIFVVLRAPRHSIHVRMIASKLTGGGVDGI